MDKHLALNKRTRKNWITRQKKLEREVMIEDKSEVEADVGGA